jgi:hypothetical protein
VAIDEALIAQEAFFLYAETYLPSEEAREATLTALQSCADGTSRATPSVATYVFRPSPHAERIGARLYPGSVAVESTELYLTHKGFRDHLATEEFRSGLRAMYKGTRRLGARLFWIGARPASDMMHNIYRSDPLARPVMPVRERLFDAGAYMNARHEDVAICSLSRVVAPGEGVSVMDAVDRISQSLETISFVAFFHPLAPELLRLFLIAAVDGPQTPALFGEAFAHLTAADDNEPLAGMIQVHRDRADLAQALRHAFPDERNWAIQSGGYSGYISHPVVATEQERAG